MAGALLRLLHGDGRLTGQRRLKLLALAADHDHLPRRRQLGGAGQQMIDHRPPGDLVEHFVQATFHAGALACGKNNDGKGRRFVCHG